MSDFPLTNDLGYQALVDRLSAVYALVHEVEHHDIGQMNLYLGYFAAEENSKGDNPPIGIILTRHKDELLVEYAIYKMDSQLFVQKYQLYLPDREELRGQLEAALQEAVEQEQPQNLSP